MTKPAVHVPDCACVACALGDDVLYCEACGQETPPTDFAPYCEKCGPMQDFGTPANAPDTMDESEGLV